MAILVHNAASAPYNEILHIQILAIFVQFWYVKMHVFQKPIYYNYPVYILWILSNFTDTKFCVFLMFKNFAEILNIFKNGETAYGDIWKYRILITTPGVYLYDHLLTSTKPVPVRT